jgi:biofilm protein TabA
MIFDSLPNLITYLSVHPLFPIVSEFIYTHDGATLSLGKLPISGGVYLNKNEYFTANIPSKFIECHRRYIDLHMVIEGHETIGFCNRNACTVIEKYDEEKDLEKLNGACHFLTLEKSSFGVFFPQDAHIPGLHVDNQRQSVIKIVFKIPI